MLNDNTNTRAFAESLGRAICHGQNIVTCDALLNPQSYGFFYYANDSIATVVSPTDPKGAYSYWAGELREAQALAERYGQDPATYGIMMTYDHGRGCIYLNLVRVEYMKSRALDMAENDGVQCPSTITEFGRNQENKRISLDEEGRSPYPQPDDPAGRAEVEAGRNREDVEDAAMLFQNLGFTSEKGTDPTEKKDSLDEWLDDNVSFG
tara:strand:- start:26821 stop:27444 length:624 start_codon:yes stop_codon:yes gene_type:complete